MSAEGKKKRGESGVANARNIAFRYGGSKCDLSTRIGSTTHPRLAGSRLVQAMVAASAIGAQQLSISSRLIDATQAAMDNCTHRLLQMV